MVSLGFKIVMILNIILSILSATGCPMDIYWIHGGNTSTPLQEPPMTNTIHPIEFALAVVLATVESALWLINELAGFHTQPVKKNYLAPIISPQDAPCAPPVRDTRTDNEIYYSLYMQHDAERLQPLMDVAHMTKRELQAFTGIKSSRYDKAALLRIAVAKVTPAQ